MELDQVELDVEPEGPVWIVVLSRVAPVKLS
jgi:hypothetical protein